jgi:hypothetical protein
MAVTILMVTVTVLLVVSAFAAGVYLTRRAGGLSRVDRERWKPVTRGRVAARRRRHEANLVVGLTRQTMTRADYRHAMSELAAADETRCPVRVPGTGGRRDRDA